MGCPIGTGKGANVGVVLKFETEIPLGMWQMDELSVYADLDCVNRTFSTTEIENNF